MVLNSPSKDIKRNSNYEGKNYTKMTSCMLGLLNDIDLVGFFNMPMFKH